MKRILIATALLIWSRAGFGQAVYVKSTPVEYSHPPHWNLVVPGYAEAKGDSSQNLMTFENFLDLWEKYKSECYADSTLEGFGYWTSDMGSTWWNEVSTADTINSEWYRLIKPYKRFSHKGVSFDGFMQFLKKKVGAK